MLFRRSREELLRRRGHGMVNAQALGPNCERGYLCLFGLWLGQAGQQGWVDERSLLQPPQPHSQTPTPLTRRLDSFLPIYRPHPLLPPTCHPPWPHHLPHHQNFLRPPQRHHPKNPHTPTSPEQRFSKISPGALFSTLPYMGLYLFSCSRFILNLPQEELASVERVCFQVEQA